MTKSSPVPVDIKLYNKVKKEAKLKFLKYPSIYANSWVVREYKKRGGKYQGKKSDKQGLTRWFKEDWVDLNRPIKKDGKIVGHERCGRRKAQLDNYPLCRPSKRVSRKTPVTISELNDSEIRLAKRKKETAKNKRNVRFKSPQAGGSATQFYGKKSKLMIPIPDSVKRAARKAFELRTLGFGGATKTGWNRASQLVRQQSIPIEDLRYMRNWYVRHVFASYPSYKKWIDAGKPTDKQWFKLHGIVSWLTWGGNAGFRWVNSQKVIDILNRHFNKTYQKVSSLNKF